MDAGNERGKREAGGGPGPGGDPLKQRRDRRGCKGAHTCLLPAKEPAQHGRQLSATL